MTTGTPVIPTLDTVGPCSYVAEFESIGHAIKLAQASGVGRDLRSASVVDYRNKQLQGGSWTNYATFEKIDQWMVQPQPGLVAAVEDMKRRIEDIVETPVRERRKVRRNREDGEELDAQAVLERRADGWSDIHHTPVPKHSITVAVNLTVASFCSASHLLYRGAAAAALADLLTQSGHSVEVIGFVAVKNLSDQTRDMVLRVPLKRSDTPMDLTSLSVAAAEIGFFRVVMIACLGRVTPGRVHEGFGTVRSMRPEELKAAGVDVCMDADITNEEAAVCEVRKAMAKFAAARSESR